MSTSRLIAIATASLAVALAQATTALAQNYPERTITLIVPYAAGGSADILPRRIAEHMQASLGRPVIIENVAGAAGNIGTQRLARATPDGYTFGLGTWSTHVANAGIYSLQYDVQQDFAPIALIATSPLMIAAKKSFPADDLKQLIAWLRANPDKAPQATNGPGSVMHVAGVLFQQDTKTRFPFVPYRGGGPAIQDLVAGHIDLYMGLTAEILPQALSGAIKAYAVTSGQRMQAAPHIPTAHEAGLPNFHVSAWFGFWTKAGVPQDAITKLNAAVVMALKDQAVRSRITNDLGMEIPPEKQQSADSLRIYQRAEIEKWWPIIKAANIRPD